MANKEIIKIEPTLYPKIKYGDKKRGKLKVAACARVSTEKDNQTHSLIAQKEHYTKVIQANEGLSGTSFRKRVAFQEMIEKVKSGEVEYIITKSISRFARNTLDTLTTIRMLKSIGVGVWFEKEGIDTLDAKGEFVLTLMSSLTQEESRSISENIVWGQRKRFTDGKATAPFGRFMGYDMGPNGEFVVNEEQAKAIKAMFAMAVVGMPLGKIRKHLNQLGIKTPADKEWGYTTVASIIKNEKYKGDALLQKTFTSDFLTKSKKKNEGELPQHYVENHHQEIVPRVVFDYVQTLSLTGRTTHNPMGREIICQECGSYYGPRTWHASKPIDKQYKYRARVWQSKQLTACSAPHIYDEQLARMLDEAIRQVFSQRGDLIGVLSDILGFDVGEKIAEFKIGSRENVALIIERNVVEKDRRLIFTFIDGNEMGITMFD